MNERFITFIETASFKKFCKKLIGDKERLKLKTYLDENPKAGDVIPGMKGLRKLRWKRPNMGKRGGVRVIYYFYDKRNILTLITIYSKSDMENMDKKTLKLYRKLVDEIINSTDGDKND